MTPEEIVARIEEDRHEGDYTLQPAYWQAKARERIRAAIAEERERCARLICDLCGSPSTHEPREWDGVSWRHRWKESREYFVECEAGPFFDAPRERS